MKESDYINVSDYHRCRTAIQILSELCTGKDRTIPEEEKVRVLGTIWMWQDRLNQAIEIKEDE